MYETNHPQEIQDFFKSSNLPNDEDEAAHHQVHGKQDIKFFRNVLTSANSNGFFSPEESYKVKLKILKSDITKNFLDYFDKKHVIADYKIQAENAKNNLGPGDNQGDRSANDQFYSGFKNFIASKFEAEKLNRLHKIFNIHGDEKKFPGQKTEHEGDVHKLDKFYQKFYRFEEPEKTV